MRSSWSRFALAASGPPDHRAGRTGGCHAARRGREGMDGLVCSAHCCCCRPPAAVTLLLQLDDVAHEHMNERERLNAAAI